MRRRLLAVNENIDGMETIYLIPDIKDGTTHIQGNYTGFRDINDLKTKYLFVAPYGNRSTFNNYQNINYEFTEYHRAFEDEGMRQRAISYALTQTSDNSLSNCVKHIYTVYDYEYPQKEVYDTRYGVKKKSISAKFDGTTSETLNYNEYGVLVTYCNITTNTTFSTWYEYDPLQDSITNHRFPSRSNTTRSVSFSDREEVDGKYIWGNIPIANANLEWTELSETRDNLDMSSGFSASDSENSVFSDIVTGIGVKSAYLMSYRIDNIHSLSLYVSYNGSGKITLSGNSVSGSYKVVQEIPGTLVYDSNAETGKSSLCVYTTNQTTKACYFNQDGTVTL